jgi:hypothetical protein
VTRAPDVAATPPGRPGALALFSGRAWRKVEEAASLLYRPPFTVLSVRSDLYGWALDQEAAALVGVARGLGLRVHLNRGLSPRARQCTHHASQFVLADGRALRGQGRASIDYFHGRPEWGPEFKATLDGLRAQHERLARVRVCNRAIEQMVLEAGVAP